MRLIGEVHKRHGISGVLKLFKVLDDFTEQRQRS